MEFEMVGFSLSYEWAGLAQHGIKGEGHPGSLVAADQPKVN